MLLVHFLGGPVGGDDLLLPGTGVPEVLLQRYHVRRNDTVFEGRAHYVLREPHGRRGKHEAWYTYVCSEGLSLRTAD